MLKRISNALLVGLIVGQLLSSACVSTSTIKKRGFEPFLRNKPVTNEELATLQKEYPNDVVFADLLQAFALMRSPEIENAKTRKEILGLLELSASSFEDMRDPINFSKAFSADENKPFRGRPHERMFASTMAGVMLMADNKCAEALPYLRNAEFLDARFQKTPFGTDAPLIYALMYRCMVEKNSAKADIEHAASGVLRSVRFLTMQDTLINALVEVAAVDLRPMSIVNRITNMLYEISIYHSLMTAPNSYNINELLDDAAKNVSIFISSLRTNFEDEYRVQMMPLIEELARVYGMDKKAGIKYLEELAFDRIGIEAKEVADKLKRVFDKHAVFKAKIHEDTRMTKDLTERILKAASADKMMLTFMGTGPILEREGSYQEISVIKPSATARTESPIRKRDLKTDTSCGFHHKDKEGDFTLVLCKPNMSSGYEAKVEVLPSLELLSLSRKAMSAQGRKFDKVLEGRAQFRAATEKIAEISAWSALFLFHMGAVMFNDCNRRQQSQACYTGAYVLWAIAGATIVFSGTVWLIGKTKNPSADSRYIHLMYESVYVAI